MDRTAWARPARAFGLMMAGVLAWLWPIGIGGAMPVGGDVTQFSIGLMAVLGRAWRAGRLPLWNDLWGFGFPGLAESQMGVYYPPHILLYGLLPLEWAYTASLVLHTAWAAAGAFWASRRFGASAGGAALAGFVFATSGFFVVHLPHQWGYTAGSWMPWAWGLAWPLVRGRAGMRTALALAAVLALQVLPGHFQVAFETQVGILGMMAWALFERSEDRTRTAFGVLRTALALAWGFGLAGAQVVPTARLARLAEAQRDFEYLSGFAASPIHLVSYVAPGLFHRSRLWRPVAWDPFHTSPEEHLAYVGLVPLFLALGVAGRAWRDDRGVRALVVLALGSLVLSLGPYLPGFSIWCRLPGFSFFRAPARWSLATALALALLAGLGFDRCRGWPRRGIGWFLMGAALFPLVVILGFEMALASTSGAGWPTIASGFDRALGGLPWSGDPPFRAVMAEARRPRNDLLTLASLAREGVAPTTGHRLDRDRFRLYRLELGPTAALLLALGLVGGLARRDRAFRAALLLLTGADLILAGQLRPVDLGPIRPLEAQSPVLARLARGPRGLRVIDGSRNLPMVAGASPVAAYRTLDLPALPGLVARSQGPPDLDPMVSKGLRATGTGLRILGPIELAAIRRRSPGWPGLAEGLTIADPALASWLYGQAWVASQGPWASRFHLWRPGREPPRAWLVSPGPPADPLAVLDDARPLPWRSPVPERSEVDVEATGPGLVVVSGLFEPQWRGTWDGPDGSRPAALRPIFEGRRSVGWQAAPLPGPGRWTLRLEYDGKDARLGLIVSALAGTAWLLAWLPGHRRGRTIPHRPDLQPP